MSNDPFGELRSLLQRSPSPARWDALIELLESWPDPDDLTRRAVPYALDIVRKQPGPRPAPLAWLGVLHRDPDATLPLLPLIDTLRLSRSPQSLQLASERYEEERSRQDPPNSQRRPHVFGHINIGTLMAHVERKAGLMRFDEFVGPVPGGRGFSSDQRTLRADPEARLHLPSFDRLLERVDLDSLRAVEVSNVECDDAFLRKLYTRHGKRLERLSLWASLRQNTTLPLCELSRFESLRELDLGVSELTADSWAELTPLPRLELLRLTLSSFDLTAFHSLACSPWFDGLEGLDVRHLRAPEAPLGVLFSRLPASLETLRVGGCAYDRDALLALCASDAAPGLVTLDLGDILYADELTAFDRTIKGERMTGAMRSSDNAAFFAAASRMTSLHRLELPHLRLSEREREALRHAGHFVSIRELDLSGNGLTDEGVAELLKTPLLDGILKVDLSANKTSRGLGRLLATAPALRDLESLTLRHVKLGDGAIKELARAGFVGGLESLDLCGNDFRADGGLAHLLDALSADRIRHLDLSSNPLDDQAARALVSADLRGLVCLRVDSKLLSSSGHRMLKERYPFVVLVDGPPEPMARGWSRSPGLVGRGPR